MARGFRQASRAALVFWVLAGICETAVAIDGQSEISPAAPVPLSRKEASKLLLSQQKPAYPPLARVNYIQGKVHMEITVTRDGHVSEAHVLSGHPFLAASALKAIRNWVYRPWVTKDGARPFQTDVDVNFALRLKALEHVPPQAQLDLERQVHPPAVLDPPATGTRSETARLRVLVGADGKVMDSAPLGGPPGPALQAENRVRHWRFRPARWGNMPVPWYLDVAVPFDDPPSQQSAAKTPRS